MRRLDVILDALPGWSEVVALSLPVARLGAIGAALGGLGIGLYLNWQFAKRLASTLGTHLT